MQRAAFLLILPALSACLPGPRPYEGPTPEALQPDAFVGCYQARFHGPEARRDGNTAWQMRLFAEPAMSERPGGGRGLPRRRATASFQENDDPWWRLIPGGFQLHVGNTLHGVYMEFAPSGDGLAGRVFDYSDTRGGFRIEPVTAYRVHCAPPAPAGAVDAADAGISVAAFRRLRWVEGRWRGEQPNGQPFFEGYLFLNDSTIRSYAYADASARAVTDSGAITLRGGQVTTGSGGARWVATELTATRVRFAPLAGARNSFVWERTSGDAWTATLSWPATTERPAREVVYPMTRLQP